MRILFVGDVFGAVGRRILAHHLASLIDEQGIDICIANGENAAGGKGITLNILRKFFRYGVHVVTGGNHSFASQEATAALDSDDRVLRPYNFPPGNSGHGFTVFRGASGADAAVLNLQGRTFFGETLECPFRCADHALEQIAPRAAVVIVDFHCEATSEKKALLYHLDGRVSAVLGTHTHVQTADEQVSDRGTAYISDVGMTGPERSCIGMRADGVIRKFLLQTYVRFEPAEEGPVINAVVLDIDERSGEARSISRINRRVDIP